MSKLLIEDNFDETEQVEELTIRATDEDFLTLMQKFSGSETPTKVVMQAMAIATYDRASAFRYADHYLDILKNKKKQKQKKLIVLDSVPKFSMNLRYADSWN